MLEYVTLANAFLLVVSLAWLHTRFVNPKGGQGSAVSCLPAALARAGVDPAKLHVLQVHTYGGLMCIFVDAGAMVCTTYVRTAAVRDEHFCGCLSCVIPFVEGSGVLAVAAKYEVRLWTTTTYGTAS